MSRVLIVDDEESICWGLSRLLKDEGYDVTTAASAEEALATVESAPPDLALLDVRLPGIDGLTALERLRRAKHDFPVIVVTAYGNLDTAVLAVDRGAFDYLTKPFDLEHVVEVVKRASESLAKNAGPRLAPPPATTGEELLGAGPAMQEVFKRIALAAPTESSVLIVGESGTGKELAARALHRHSRNADGPFVPIHLGALNASLVESELFGHAKGAFTGADFDRPGLLESADGGTVFFDEAADIPPQVQVKLLRVLQQREVTRVGEVKPRPCRFRVIAAVNRDPAECVRTGTLRADLLYRLAGFEIRLPALRERSEDIPLLARRFLQSAIDAGSTARGISAAALAELKSRAWAGNVRELRNAVERAAIFARGGMIEPAHLPPPGAYETRAAVDVADEVHDAIIRWSEAAVTGKLTTADLYDRLLKVIEPPLFEVVLRKTLGNRAAAAEILGLHRATLRKKLSERRGTKPEDAEDTE
ncbi:MAG: sigma-54-dependent Fis family transcriptional regulator [Planctomycetales bacterium]|nr:sigma-54-dependent Fis family transcriptional regulator [Planctomycetales bacterium]MBN8624952.1 sigma-54-dependent Fis family transcriptional regulator [Planctomycetota bacterium]